MAESGGGLGAGRDRIRDAAKWLTVSVGGVAAVMVAGTQLSSVGSLALGSGRFWVVVLGALLAIAGTGVVLWSTTATLTMPAVSLHGVAGTAPKGTEQTLTDPFLLAGHADVGALETAFTNAIVVRDAAFEKYLEAPGDKQLSTRAKVTDAKVADLGTVVNQFLDVVSYQALAHRWRESRRAIVAGAAVAALGIGALAWAANPPAGAAGTAASPAVLTAPEAGTLQLTDGGRQALSGKLGEECAVDGPLDVLVLKTGDAGADVVVTDTGCNPTRFLLVSAWGAVG